MLVHFQYCKFYANCLQNACNNWYQTLVKIKPGVMSTCIKQLPPLIMHCDTPSDRFEHLFT